MKYEKIVLETFLEKQNQLFDEPMAETLEEADDFLDDCMAVVLQNIKEVREYWEQEGLDVGEMTDKQLAEELEVFSIPDGRYLVVEA